MAGHRKQPYIVKFMKWIALPLLALLIYSIVGAETFVVMDGKLEQLDPFAYWFIWFMVVGVMGIIITLCFRGKDWVNPATMPKKKK